MSRIEAVGPRNETVQIQARKENGRSRSQNTSGYQKNFFTYKDNGCIKYSVMTKIREKKRIIFPQKMKTCKNDMFSQHLKIVC